MRSLLLLALVAVPLIGTTAEAKDVRTDRSVRARLPAGVYIQPAAPGKQFRFSFKRCFALGLSGNACSRDKQDNQVRH